MLKTAVALAFYKG